MTESDVRTESEIQKKLDELHAEVDTVGDGKDNERLAQIRALRWVLKENTSL